MKSLLCAIVKNENKYLKDWINYHYKLGFDKIVLCDNNDTEYIQEESVDILDYRNIYIDSFGSKNSQGFLKYGVQEKAYNECYHKYSEEYDWIAYFDIDEYLILDNDLTINEFLSQDKFKDVDAIQINWTIYNDNGHVRYEDIPVMERFTHPVSIRNNYVKTIIKTKNPRFISLPVHYANIIDGKYVYPDGTPTEPSLIQEPKYEGARINHYYTKTIEEWIERKYNTTNAIGIINQGRSKINEFFDYNEATPEKIALVEKTFGVKLKKTVYGIYRLQYPGEKEAIPKNIPIPKPIVKNPKNLIEYLEYTGPIVNKTKDFTVYILCGLPGAGKSTYAETQLSDKVIISIDQVRKDYHPNENEKLPRPWSQEIKIQEIVDNKIKECCENKQDCVIDYVHLTQEQRKETLQKVIKYNPFIKMIYIDTPAEICAERRKKELLKDSVLHLPIECPQSYEYDELITIKTE